MRLANGTPVPRCNPVSQHHCHRARWKVPYICILCTIIFVLQFGFLSSHASAQRNPPSVWFFPAGRSADLDDLFTAPASWAETRVLIGTFGFSEGQIETGGSHGQSRLYQRLVRVDAFRRVGTWGLETALQVPALKPWDCAARQTPSITDRLIQKIYSAGGTVQFLGMDAPLVSALGRNGPENMRCSLDFDAAAREVAAYVQTVKTQFAARERTPVVRFVDSEAYPALSVADLELWMSALERHGFKPEGLNLDVNVGYLDANPAAGARLAGDLQELQRFLRSQQIGFGVIIWSGYDPVRSHADYYHQAIAWARKVHEAIGRPDRIIFASWVRRCKDDLECRQMRELCKDPAAASCPPKGAPRNLPESGADALTHTRLIKDAMALFSGS